MNSDQASDHFTFAELTFSQTALRLGIDNTPPPDAYANLTTLAVTLLEPIRQLWGCAVHVDSGYRCPQLNAAIGGAADSAHMDGRAADTIPIGMALQDAFEKLRASDLPIDQCIIECGAWLHVAIAKDGETPRRQFMTASGGPGHWSYTEV
jgi:hypothetical protein